MEKDNQNISLKLTKNLMSTLPKKRSMFDINDK